MDLPDDLPQELQVRVVVAAANYAPLGDFPLACMWDNASLEVVNLAQPWLTLTGNEALYEGTSNAWSIQCSSANAADVTVTITSDRPYVVTSPDSVVIPTGSTATTFFVTGLTTGSATLFASAEGIQPAQKTASVTLRGLSLSGAASIYVNSTNTWSVTRDGPLDADTVVRLSNSAPSAACVPTQVVIQAASSSATFSVEGRAAGTASIIASADSFQTGSKGVSILQRTLTFSSPGGLYVGTTGQCTVVRSGPIAGDLTVTLGNGAPGIIAIPSSVLISDGESNGTFLVSGLAVGSAGVTASASGYSATGVLVTVTSSHLNLLGGSVVPFQGSNLWTVTRAGSIQDSLEVSLDVDDADILDVQSTVVIEAMATSATFYVSGRGAWVGTLTASASGYSPVQKSATVSRSILQNSGFEDGPGFTNGWFSWGDCGVEMWAAHTGERGVALYGWLAGAFGGFAQDVPVSSHAGGDVYSFSIEGKAEEGFGSSSTGVVLRMDFLQGETVRHSEDVNIYTALTAARDTWNRHTMVCTNTDTLVDTVRVSLQASDYNPTGNLVAAMWDNADLSLFVDSESNLMIAGNPIVFESSSSLWAVVRSGSMDDSLSVTLTLLTTGTASVASSVIIPAGTNSAGFYVTGLSSGSTVIKASAAGLPSVWQPVTVQKSTLTLQGATTLYTSSTSQWIITRMGSKDAPLTVTLSSSKPQIASVPASVTMEGGSTSAFVAVSGVLTGAATITATADGCTSTSRAVSVAQRYLQLSGLTNVYAGLSNTWMVARCGPADEAITVTLSNHAPSVAEAPVSVDLGIGDTEVAFGVSGIEAGTALLEAVAPGYQAAGHTLSVASNRLVLTGLMTVAPGYSNHWTITRTGPLSSPLTVDLAIDDPSVVDAPKSITIAADTNTASFFVEGLSVGSATITATSPGLLSSALGMLVTDNLLRNPGFEEGPSWGDAWGAWGDIGVEAWAAETGERGVALFGWMQGSYGGCYQDVPITTSTNGDVYVFSLDGRSDPDFRSSSGSLELQMQFWNADMQLLFAVTNSIYDDLRSQAEAWNTYVISAVNTNTAVHVVRVTLLAANYAPTGYLSAAMWDNASLQKHTMLGSNLLLTGRGAGYAGTSNRWLVTRIGPCADSLAVTFSSDQSSVATVDGSVSIPAGAASAPVTIVIQTNQSPAFRRYDGDPLAPTATITAEADGYPPTNKDIVAQANVLTLSGQASIYVSLSNRWTVTRSGPVAESISVDLNSDDPAVLDLPTSVAIGAGSASADFFVTALDAGTATITAAADGYASTSRVVTATNVAPDIATGTAADATLLWMGKAGSRYLVEEALALAGPWTQVRNIHCSQSGELQWQDSNFANATSKYYRILMLITNAPDSAYSR